MAKGKVVPFGKEHWVLCPICEYIIGKDNVKKIDQLSESGKPLYHLHCDMCFGVVEVDEDYVKGKI